MSSSSSGATATGPVPLDRIPLARQGRHAAGDPFDPEPSYEVALARLLAGDPGAPAPSDRPLLVKQRIARDTGDLRRLREALPGMTDQGRRDETDSAIRALTESLRQGNQTLDRLIEEGRTRRWGPSDFEPGDQARYLSAWYEVVSVGPVGLTLRFHRPRDGSAWSVPAEYIKVTGRRRGEAEELDES